MGVLLALLVLLVSGCGVTIIATPTPVPPRPEQATPQPPPAATPTPVPPQPQATPVVVIPLPPQTGPNERAYWDPTRQTWVVESQSPPTTTSQQGSTTLSPTVASVPRQKASWPLGPTEAAATFGGEARRWEPTADCCGWHLREEASRVSIDPRGFAMEGYYDTRPGRDPRQFVAVDPVEVQGATIWRDADGPRVFCAMIGQKYRNTQTSFDQVKDGIDAVGFSKPAACPGP